MVLKATHKCQWLSFKNRINRGKKNQTCFIASTRLLRAVVCSIKDSAASSWSLNLSTRALASASAFSMVQLISKGIHRIKNEKHSKESWHINLIFSSTLTHIMLKLHLLANRSLSQHEKHLRTPVVLILLRWNKLKIYNIQKIIHNIYKYIKLYITYIHICVYIYIYMKFENKIRMYLKHLKYTVGTKVYIHQIHFMLYRLLYP